MNNDVSGDEVRILRDFDVKRPLHSGWFDRHHLVPDDVCIGHSLQRCASQRLRQKPDSAPRRSARTDMPIVIARFLTALRHLGPREVALLCENQIPRLDGKQLRERSIGRPGVGRLEHTGHLWLFREDADLFGKHPDRERVLERHLKGNPGTTGVGDLPPAELRHDAEPQQQVLHIACQPFGHCDVLDAERATGHPGGSIGRVQS